MRFRRGLTGFVSALLAAFVCTFVCASEAGPADSELAPATFARLSPERAAEALHNGLVRGELTFRSAADIAEWLRVRPNAWRSDDRANPLRSYNSELPRLTPEAQAWLIVAALWIKPDLENPPKPGIESGAEPDPAKGERPVLPFIRFNPGSLRGPVSDFPAAAAVIAERVRQSLASEQRQSLPEAPLDDPSAQFKLLVAVARGDPTLASDANLVTNALKSRGTWSPARQIGLGLDLLAAAANARDEAARSALVFPATDAIIEGAGDYYRAHPWMMRIYGPVSSLYATYTSEEEPIVRDIRRRFFQHAAQENCPNFGEDLLPIPAEALAALWTGRFAKGLDALCLWYPPHWVPVDAIVAQYPEAALNLVAHPSRSGDSLRREILLARLRPYIFADGDQTGSAEGEPTGLASNPGLGRALRAEVKPPLFRLDMDAHGLAIVRFRDPTLEHAWRSRPASRMAKPRDRDDLAPLAALLGVAESDVRSLVEQAFVPRGCRGGPLNATVWGGLNDRWRLARLECIVGRQDRPLPLESEAWPRNASEAEASSWLVWDYEPLILADARGARVVWLPGRVWGSGPREYERIVGVANFAGSLLMVAQSTDGPCNPDGCTREDLGIELTELFDDVFTFPRWPAKAK